MSDMLRPVGTGDLCMQRVASTWLSLPVFPDNTPNTHTISPAQRTRDMAHRKWHILWLEQLLHISLGGKLISQHSSPEHSSPANRARRQQKPNRGTLCIERTWQCIWRYLSEELNYLISLGSPENVEGPIGPRACLSESMGSQSEHRQLPIAL